MKFEAEYNGNGAIWHLELTRRNLEGLLAKLDDPASVATLVKTSEDRETYIYVKAVENEMHYSDRAPGAMYMPTTGETR